MSTLLSLPHPTNTRLMATTAVTIGTTAHGSFIDVRIAHPPMPRESRGTLDESVAALRATDSRLRLFDAHRTEKSSGQVNCLSASTRGFPHTAPIATDADTSRDG